MPPPRPFRPRRSRGGVGAAGVIMMLALFCAVLAPVGWVPSRLTYALHVGQAAHLEPHPIDQELISLLARRKATNLPPSPYAFYASQASAGAGAPPPGLDVDADTGALVGTPTIAGTYTVAVGISDGRIAHILGPAFTVRVLPPS